MDNKLKRSLIITFVIFAISIIGSIFSFTFAATYDSINKVKNKSYLVNDIKIKQVLNCSGADLKQLTNYCFCCEEYNKYTNAKWKIGAIIDINRNGISKQPTNAKSQTNKLTSNAKTTTATNENKLYGKMAYYAFLQNQYGFDYYGTGYKSELRYMMRDLKKSPANKILGSYGTKNIDTDTVKDNDSLDKALEGYASFANSYEKNIAKKSGAKDTDMFSVKQSVPSNESGYIGPFNIGLKSAYAQHRYTIKVHSKTITDNKYSGSKTPEEFVGVAVDKIEVKTKSGPVVFNGSGKNKVYNGNKSKVINFNSYVWNGNFYLKPSSAIKSEDIQSITVTYKYYLYNARYALLSGKYSTKNTSAQGYMAFAGFATKYTGIINLKTPEQNGNITIKKVSTNQNTAIQGAKFNIIQQTGTNKFVTIQKNKTTDSKGTIKVTGLPLGYTYYIQEIESSISSIYDIDSINVSAGQGKLVSLNGKNAIRIDGLKNKTSKTVNISTTLTNTPKNETNVLRLRKVSSADTNKGISGVTFTIYKQIDSSRIVKCNSAKTNSDGYTDPIELEKGYKYYIKETSGNADYDSGKLALVDNGGNENNKISSLNGQPVMCLVSFENSNDSNKTITVVLSNPPKTKTGDEGLLDISGNVFLDVPVGKQSKPDGLLNSSDKAISGIPVTLYTGDTVVGQTTTDSNGYYSFANLDKNKSYYIKYTYDGLAYTATYYNVASLNGSYATETPSERQSLNNRFQVVSNKTVKGNTQINAYTGQGGLSNLGKISGNGTFAGNLTTSTRYRYEYETAYDAEGKPYTVTIPIEIVDVHVTGINFGIIEREQADVALAKDVFSATMRIKNHEETYSYNSRRLNTTFDTWEIKERLNISDYFTKAYDRSVYPSDYAYKYEIYNQLAQNVDVGKDSELDVFVTYLVKVKNSSATLEACVNEFVDYYDEDYEYVADRSYTVINNTKVPLVVSNSSKYGNSQNLSGFKSLYVQVDKTCEDAKTVGNMQSGGSLGFYITFRVTKDGNRNIKLDQDLTTLQISSGKENIAEISAYSTYNGNATIVPNTTNSKGTVAGVFDTDSNPGNITDANKTNYASYEDDTDHAPNIRIILGIEKDNREISGIVWEDARNKFDSTFNTNTGNGIREDNEEKINGVRIQLVEKFDNKEIVWKEFESGSTEDLSPIIGFKVNGKELLSINKNAISKGKYVFKSYVPGHYFIRFIYGDSNKTALTTSTSWCGDVKGLNAKSYNGLDYKSTIYQVGAETINSDAKDIFSRRQSVQSYASTMNNHIANVVDIYKRPVYDSADANIELVKEFVNKTYMTAITGDYDATVGSGSFSNIDLGLQERAKPQLILDKSVQNVKVVLSNGNLLYDASQKMSHVIWNTLSESHSHRIENGILSKLSLRNKKGLVQLTVDDEYLTGANVIITYRLTVANVGEVDYSDENYYNTGVVTSKDTIVKTSARKVFDYVDNNLTFNESLNTGWKTIEPPAGVSKSDYLINNGLMSAAVKEEIDQTNVILVTDSLSKELAPGESISKDLVLTKTISGDEGDTSFRNLAEIVEISNPTGVNQKASIVGNQDPTSVEANEVDSAIADTVTLLTPFGAAKDVAKKAVVIIGALAIVGAGIYFIRRKVVNKDN